MIGRFISPMFSVDGDEAGLMTGSYRIGFSKQALLVGIFIAVVSVAEAAWIVDRALGGHTLPGTVLEIDLVPQKPAPGAPFAIVVSGIATEYCPLQNYQRRDARPDGVLIYAEYESCEVLPGGELECSLSCELEDLPLEFEERIEVPASFWDDIEVSSDFEITVGTITEGDPVEGRQKGAFWRRSFDLLRGTHAIPPRLDSGFWVRDDLQSEGLLIQQQGDTVVFYDLSYGPETTVQDNAVGTWLYSSAVFHGDSSNGLAIKVAKPDPGQGDVEFEEERSSSIIVDGYNQVQAMFDARELSDSEELEHAPYRRWQFNRTTFDRPAVIPDFSGGWTVYRFNGAEELDRLTIRLDEGSFLDTDRWQFPALDTEQRLICKVNNRGAGRCQLSQLDSEETLWFEMIDFNGNVAIGEFRDESDEFVDDAVFLREGFELP